MLATQNRRRFERVPFFTRVTVSPPSGASPIEARSLDVSLGGVGLVAPTGLPVGTVVMLTFYLGRSPKTSEERLYGRITNVRAESDGSLIGIEFSRVLDAESAPALVRAIDRL
jgi:c-di-GMP-binding flagellar brake protein YcgR